MPALSGCAEIESSMRAGVWADVGIGFQGREIGREASVQQEAGLRGLYDLERERDSWGVPSRQEQRD